MDGAEPSQQAGEPATASRPRLRLTHKLLAALLVLSVVPLAVAGILAYGRLDTVVHAQTQATLKVAVDGARATIRQFLAYLKGRTLDVATDWYIRDTVEQLGRRPGAGGLLADLERYLRVSRTLVPEMAEIFVLDPRGHVLASSDPQTVGRDHGRAGYFDKGRTGVYVSDLFRSAETGRVTWVVSAPLSSRHSGAFLGVVACRIDPTALSDITTGRKETAFGAQSQPMRMGRTGEVYIVDRHHLMLTESRFLPDVLLRHAVETEPVRRAFEHGQDMLGDYRDYRGVPTTGASALLGEMGWVVVAEVDFAEAFAPVRRLRTELLALGLLLLPAVGLLGLVIQRSIIRPMRRIIEADARVVRTGPADGLIAEAQIPRDEWQLVMSRRNHMLRRLEEQSRSLLDESERRRREAEVLADLAERINAAADPGAVLQRVAEGARELTGSDGGAVVLADRVLDCDGEALPAGAAVVRQALLTGRPCRTDRYPSDPRFEPADRDAARAAGVTAALAVPIPIDRRSAGVVYVHSRAPRPFTERDEAILVGLANQAGIAIQTARLVGELRARQGRLEALIHLTRGLSRIQSEESLRQRITAACRDLLDADRVGLHLVEGRAPVLPAGGSPPAAIREVGATGESITMEHVGDEAVLALPLKLGESVLGVLTIAARGRPGFSPDDVTLATMFAGQAAAALETGRLYREAQEADRRKDEFLAMLAHELRNPLGPILNAVRVLDRVGAPEPEASRFREIIGRQAQRLARLVDDLLDVARVSYGKIPLHLQPVDLADVARRSLQSFHESGRGRDHDVSLAVGPEPVMVEGDPLRLEQIVGNLLDNAAKYSGPGTPIGVIVEPAGADAVVRVRDRGVGIPRDMLTRIFEPLTQAARSLDRAQGGLGLGLTLVRALVELHSGSVWAESAGPGRGSEFVVRLPLRAGAEAVPAKPAGAVEAAPRRILLVEDSADARDALRALLELAGHRVDLAPDGPRGVEAALARPPEVALVDIGLPGIDGYEVARRLRAEPETQRIRLVALTGYGQPEDVRRAEAAGFDAHLTKPVDPDQLAALIARLAA